MNFKDIGIIIAKRPLTENKYIMTIFTSQHGIYSGIVRSSKNQNFSATHQIGNVVDFLWHARLSNHIGTAKCELIKSYCGPLMSSKLQLYAMLSIFNIIKNIFPEREPHNVFYIILQNYIYNLANKFSFLGYINLELALLSEAGYSLILDKCTVTGSNLDLKFISPKSGRAVSAEIGEPYASKLLIYPEFLRLQREEASPIEIRQGFAITSYFFSKDLFRGKELPEARQILLQYLLSSIKL